MNTAWKVLAGWVVFGLVGGSLYLVRELVPHSAHAGLSGGLTGGGTNPNILGNVTAVTGVFSGALSASNLSGTNTGDVMLTAAGAVPNANGASLVGQALTLQPADGTNPGILSTGTQTIAGDKTFSGAISASNLSGTNTGNITLAAVGVTPNTNGASLAGQVLNLQPADGTNPGSLTAGTQTIGGAKTLVAPLTIPDGTVAAPAVIFGGASSNSGLYLDTTDTPAVAVDGVQKMRCGTGGCVFASGINVANDGSAPITYNSGSGYLDLAVNTRVSAGYLAFGSGGATFSKSLKGSGTLDFPSALLNGCDDLTITVTGAVDGDPIMLGTPNAAKNAGGSQFDAWISGANTATVRHCCNAGMSCNPDSGTFKINGIQQ